MARVALLLDEVRGIHIPKAFASDFKFGDQGYVEGWQGVKPEALEILKKGPDEENYWEAWDQVLQGAFYVCNGPIILDGVTYPKGTRFTLEQDGDLWMCDAR